MRVQRTVKTTLSRVFSVDETATDATGSVTVSAARLDGTVVQTGAATGPDVNHVYTWTFNGLDVVDLLVVTWTATVGGDAVVFEDLLEVVGGFYFTVAEARSTEKSKFSDVAAYPQADVLARRSEAEDRVEAITGQAWVPRFTREVLSGSGRSQLMLRWPLLRKVRAVSVGGAAFSQPAVDAFGANRLGVLRRPTTWPEGDGNIVVEYEHGHDRPTSGIVRAAKIVFRSLMLTTRSPLPDRAERIATTELGTVVLASPTADKVGIPEADAELAAHPSPRPGFG